MWPGEDIFTAPMGKPPLAYPNELPLGTNIVSWRPSDGKLHVEARDDGSMPRYSELLHENTVFRQALERIADATPANADVATLQEMLGHIGAIAKTALAV
jgi:hypothetical protein